MEEKIVALYEEGYSQKEICQKLNLSFKYINKVLKDKGFNTNRYRNLPSEIKDMICFMINEGFHQSFISELLDISIHVVREIVYNKKLQGVAADKRTLNITSEIISMYKAGNTINKISKVLHLDRSRVKRILIKNNVFVSALDIDNQIWDSYINGVPVTDISKTLHVGYRRIKRIINERSFSL